MTTPKDAQDDIILLAHMIFLLPSALQPQINMCLLFFQVLGGHPVWELKQGKHCRFNQQQQYLLQIALL